MIVRRAVAVVGLVSLLVGALMLPPEPPAAMEGPFFGLVVVALLLVVWPGGRRSAGAAAVVVAVVSLLVTAYALTGNRFDREPDTLTTLWTLLEVATLMIFVYLPVRWAHPVPAAWGAGSACVASACLDVRFDRDWSLWSAVAVGGLWTIPALLAGLTGFYLRGLETARRQAVRDARQQQRLELAGDLHDFVAHDVSEIVAQAQAGAVVLADGNPAVTDVLRRIEAAGLRSLASMDRTIDMLSDDDKDNRAPVGVLADLPNLVREYESAGTVMVLLELDPAIGQVVREVSAVAYRVVVESLTNIRRHAGSAEQVSVTVRCFPDRLDVGVANDGRGFGRSDRTSGGRGLSGLAARVEALGGGLEAGPRADDRGWSVVATFPTGVTP